MCQTPCKACLLLMCLTTILSFILINKWKSKKLKCLCIKGFSVPQIESCFVVLLVELTGQKFTRPQTPRRLSINFTITSWPCITGAFLELGSKRNTMIENHGCLRPWKIPSGIKTNCIKSIKRLKLHLMKIIIKCTRVNCRIWWKWLKRSIIRTCLPDTKVTWKRLGMSWNLS